MRTGAGIPEPIRDAPRLWPHLLEYYTAFIELSTDRTIGMEVGPIPYSSLAMYADRFEFDVEDFVYILRQMDLAYLGHSKGAE